MNKSFTLAMAAIVAVMALAACSGSGSKLEDYVSTVNKECPADFEIGTLNSVEIVGDNVVFNYKANGEMFPVDKIKGDVDLAKDVWLMSFTADNNDKKRDFFNEIAAGGKGVKVCFAGEQQGSQFEINYSNEQVKALDLKPAAPGKQVETLVKLNKLLLPAKFDEATTLVDMNIEEGFVTYIYDIDESIVKISDMEANVFSRREMIIEGMRNVFNSTMSPAESFFKLVAVAGKGVRYQYKGNETGKSLNIDVTNTELRQLASAKSPM